MALSPNVLLQNIIAAHQLHADAARQPQDVYRRFDGKTPFIIHPLWCMATLAAETQLPEEVRRRGMLVLLYHDVYEDTKGQLPSDLPAHIVEGVRHMTFDSFQQEMRDLWEKPVEIRLYKLYDKVSNLLDWYSKDPEETKRYRDFTKRLADDVERNYGPLKIVTLARALIAA